MAGELGVVMIVFRYITLVTCHVVRKIPKLLVWNPMLERASQWSRVWCRPQCYHQLKKLRMIGSCIYLQKLDLVLIYLRFDIFRLAAEGADICESG